MFILDFILKYLILRPLPSTKRTIRQVLMSESTWRICSTHFALLSCFQPIWVSFFWIFSLFQLKIGWKIFLLDDLDLREVPFNHQNLFPIWKAFFVKLRIFFKIYYLIEFKKSRKIPGRRGSSTDESDAPWKEAVSSKCFKSPQPRDFRSGRHWKLQ